MAIKPYKEIRTTWYAVGIQIFWWENLTNGDVGAPLKCPIYADKTVQAFGTWTGPATVAIEGTIEETPANYIVLTDQAGSALDLTANSIKTLLQNPCWLRPNVTAGDGTTDVDVYLLLSNTGLGCSWVVS
jgi:hypothetical protein